MDEDEVCGGRKKRSLYKSYQTVSVVRYSPACQTVHVGIVGYISVVPTCKEGNAEQFTAAARLCIAEALRVQNAESVNRYLLHSFYSGTC